MLGEAHGPGDGAALPTAHAMVSEHAKAIGQGGLGDERRTPVGKVPRMDEDHPLPGAPDLVRQLGALDGRALHAWAVHQRHTLFKTTRCRPRGYASRVTSSAPSGMFGAARPRGRRAPARTVP